MRAEGETKGVIKRGEVVTEMCAQGFSFFLLPPRLTFMCQCVPPCGKPAVHVLNFHASRLGDTHTGPGPNTQCQNYFRLISSIQPALKII